MKVINAKLFFNNGAIIESEKIGDEIKWPNEHWSQDPNLIDKKTIQIIEEADHDEVRIDFASKWMPFHQRVTLREIDPIEITINIEETPDKILSFYYFNDWWTRPGFLKGTTEIRENTCILLLKQKDKYTCLLAMPGHVFGTRFAAGNSNNEIKLILTADAAGYAAVSELSMIAITDNNPYICVTKCMEVACKLQNISTIKERKYPEAFEKLGWCSWDAFYQEVSEAGLIEKANEIKNKSIPFGWMLIDDGWLDSTEQKLKGYDADKTKFPQGLGPCVEKIKQISGVKSVGVWHAFSGYWGGIDSEASIYKESSDKFIKTNQERILPNPQGQKAYEFYDGWHKYLSEQGIEFIKVDSQSSMRNHYRANAPIGRSGKELHKALDKSAMQNMNGNLINCMGMAMENVLARPQSAVSRNSDDFVPLRENGFEEHMLQNAFNSLYHNAIYYGDWDMFWSSHEDAKKHALLRALSGGPIYVSDKVGESNSEILKTLCYSDGTILRAAQAAVPTEDSLFNNPLEVGYLKIKNSCNNVNYLAIYAFGEKAASVEFCVEDSFMAVEAYSAEKYAVYNPMTQEVFVTDAKTIHKVNISKKGYALYLIAPIINGVAIFGSKEHYLSSHCINNCVVDDEKIELDIKYNKKIVLYSECENKPVYVDKKCIGYTHLGICEMGIK